jgi:hypothetical protein
VDLVADRGSDLHRNSRVDGERGHLALGRRRIGFRQPAATPTVAPAPAPSSGRCRPRERRHAAVGPPQSGPALPLKWNLMESAGCQSTSGSCRYAAPFGLESGRSNARDRCHYRRWGRSHCACSGLFTVGAKGTQRLIRRLAARCRPPQAKLNGRADSAALASARLLWSRYRRRGAKRHAMPAAVLR